jgi:hypothetical protein
VHAPTATTAPILVSRYRNRFPREDADAERVRAAAISQPVHAAVCALASDRYRSMVDRESLSILGALVRHFVPRLISLSPFLNIVSFDLGLLLASSSLLSYSLERVASQCGGESKACGARCRVDSKNCRDIRDRSYHPILSYSSAGLAEAENKGLRQRRQRRL